jgi:pimeloyl-ACP methyl ester carboxylesterase
MSGAAVPSRSCVDVDGRSVSYYDGGRGRPVLLIAGLGLSGRFYEHSFAPFAAAGLRLIVPDLPGFGGTRGPLTGAGAAETGEFVARFALALGIVRAGVIGHSIGWQSAARLAAERPELVSALVAAAPTVPRRGRRALRQVARFAVAALRVDSAVAYGVARDYVRTTPPRFIGTWIRHAHDDPLRFVPQIVCPLLVLLGTRDPMATPEDVRLLLRAAPRARVVRVPGGTHGLPRQNPRSFQRVTTHFLRCAPDS